MAQHQTIEQPEQMHTAKQLAEMTGMPYRHILSACASGALRSFRPAGGSKGCIYITASDWAAWLSSVQTRRTLRPMAPAPRRAGALPATVSVEDLAL